MPGATSVSISSGDDFRAGVHARRDALIEKHLKLVPPIATRLKRRLPPSFDLADLISEGNIGLVRAAARYEPEEHNQTPFSAFARPRIHGAIVDSVRRKAWEENTRNPLEDAPEPAHYRPMPFLIRGPHISGPKRRGPGRPTVAFRAAHLPPRLARALVELSTRQRVILAAFYGDAGSLTQIAADLNLSPAAAVAEHADALETLRSVLVRNVSISGLDRVYFSSAKRAA